MGSLRLSTYLYACVSIHLYACLPDLRPDVAVISVSTGLVQRLAVPQSPMAVSTAATVVAFVRGEAQWPTCWVTSRRLTPADGLSLVRRKGAVYVAVLPVWVVSFIKLSIAAPKRPAVAK